LEVFNRPFENLSDLGKDLSILMDPAARRLTEELVEVEIGFQLEDFFALLKRLLPSLKYITWSLEQLENLVDWWADMEPVLKIAVPKMIDQLDVLEQQRVFNVFGKLFSVEMLQFMEVVDVAWPRLGRPNQGPPGLLANAEPGMPPGVGVLLELFALSRCGRETPAAK
jgi:hypothetical protein